MKSFFLAIFVTVLATGGLFFSDLPVAQAADCMDNLQVKFSAGPPLSVPASTPKSFTFVAFFDRCSLGTPPPQGDYYLKIYDDINGQQGRIQAWDKVIPEWKKEIIATTPVDGYIKYSYTLETTLVPFTTQAQITAKTATYKAQVIYPAPMNGGVSSTPITFTLGTTPPPGNNAPANNAPANSCTGANCGQLNVGDFDKNVAILINPLKVDSFPELVLLIMKGFIFLIGIIAVAVIIIGGLRMVLSQGNQEAVTKGKSAIIWAVAGLIVALMSFSLVSIVQNLLGK